MKHLKKIFHTLNRTLFTLNGKKPWFAFAYLLTVSGILLTAYTVKIILKEDFIEIFERFSL